MKTTCKKQCPVTTSFRFSILITTEVVAYLVVPAGVLAAKTGSFLPLASITLC